MLQSFRNIFLIPDLRKRVFYTLGILIVYRLGSFIPVPGIDPIEVNKVQSGGILGFLNLFTGGALQRFSLFALGIMPYISASIILQLLTVVWPYLEKLSKEGEAGRRKITSWTRRLTVLIAIIQGLGVTYLAESISAGAVINPGIGFRVLAVLTFTAGTIFVMWLGERITERGIGNGISLIIFAGILTDIPGALLQSANQFRSGEMNIIKVLIICAIMVATIWLVVFVERAQRRIPIQYAKRQVGRRVMMGQSTHLPLRINTGGVIPVIFAATVVMLPQTLANCQWVATVPWAQRFFASFAYGTPLYILLYFGVIVFFCYFYVSIIFNPVDVADNIKKYGGFIPGKRPGARTAEYIDNVLSRITLGGAVYLAVVALLPMILISGTQLDKFPVLGPFFERVMPGFVLQGLGVPFYFGGTSLLIVVGVAMDTMQQIESQMIMRHYEGFLKGSRLKGRRS